MSNELGQDQGAHHGDPAIFDRDMKNFADMLLWIRIARYEQEHGLHPPNDYYGPNWYPSHPDCLKSRLFWRIRARKPILKHAPPTAMSCPWYELIEEPDRPHWVYDKPTIYTEWCGKVFDPPVASISGSSWFEILETVTDRHYVVQFKPWTFDLFAAPKTDIPQFDPITKTVKLISLDGWWLQRRKEKNEELYLDISQEQSNWGYFPTYYDYPKELDNESQQHDTV